MTLYDEVLGAARELSDSDRARLCDELTRGVRRSHRQIATANIDNLLMMCVASLGLLVGSVVTYYSLDFCSHNGYKQHPWVSSFCSPVVLVQQGVLLGGPIATTVLGGFMYAIYACLLFGARRKWIQLLVMALLLLTVHFSLMRLAIPFVTWT